MNLKVELARQNLERENEAKRQKEEEKRLAMMQMPPMMPGSAMGGMRMAPPGSAD